MKFSRFDTHKAAVRYFTRPRLNTPAAVMANAALAVAELQRLRLALAECRDNPSRARDVARDALRAEYV